MRCYLINRCFLLISAFIILSVLTSCGRYIKPLPPEAYSARSVKELFVTASLDGVLFKWSAPDQDYKGDELKEIDGYVIKRKDVQEDLKLLDESVEFLDIGTVRDTHLEELEKLKSAAKREGKLTRKIKVAQELTKFQYNDSSVKPGKTYLYQIIPVNQNGVLGQSSKYIKVFYRGDSSTVESMDNSDMYAEDYES